MGSETFENRAELPKEPNFTPPAVELLFDPEKVDVMWPETIANNKEFLEQLQERRQLQERLDAILSALPRPDVLLQDAVAQGSVSEQQVVGLYSSLIPLLSEGSEYRRIALYLPFEFFPRADWKPSTAELQQAAEQFRTAYLSAWNRLLWVHDVRANFVDGDVMDVESGTGDPPRVVKAAHLIPKLIEAGLMKTEDVLNLLETTEDDLLKQSIADTIPVLQDLGLITAEELARAQISTQSLEKAGAAAANIEEPPHITEKRAAWLEKEQQRKTVESQGDEICASLIRDELDDAIVAELVHVGADASHQQALIDGIRKAVESMAHTDHPQAQRLYDHYRETLLSLWQKDAPEIRNALEKTFYRLHGLGIVGRSTLDDLGLAIPALAGPFSKNVMAMSDEMRVIRNHVAQLESDPVVSQDVYPVALSFGSRLKGYGAKNADHDFGVFVRPGTPLENRKSIQTSLKSILFPGQEKSGDVVEFWLEETNGGLRVHTFDQPESSLGESSWTHILFGAAWEGDAKAISELREKLLVPYFFDTSKDIQGRDARAVYLEEMERDLLQYRLMHKGYERYFPPFGGIQTPHADHIDGQSMFWDSGYRQVATQLFARQVFLPKLSEKQ